jgi:hypothetical protein
MQDMVRMLEGQFMPSPVVTLASIIAITFVGSKTLPMVWLKKMFWMRRHVIHKALVWLQKNNPIYIDIHIDRSWLNELPKDNVPYKSLSVMHQQNDDNIVERERESYVCHDSEGNGPDIVVNDLDEDHRHRANDDVNGESFNRS